jgi:hypothetical protein
VIGVTYEATSGSIREGVNNRVKALTRQAYGCRDEDSSSGCVPGEHTGCTRAAQPFPAWAFVEHPVCTPYTRRLDGPGQAQNDSSPSGCSPCTNPGSNSSDERPTHTQNSATNLLSSVVSLTSTGVSAGNRDGIHLKTTLRSEINHCGAHSTQPLGWPPLRRPAHFLPLLRRVNQSQEHRPIRRVNRHADLIGVG